MNINMRLEDGLYNDLMVYALKNNVTKSQAVHNAVKKSLKSYDYNNTWSDEFFSLKGVDKNSKMFDPDESMFKCEDFEKSCLD